MGILGDILNLVLNSGGQASPQSGSQRAGGAFPQQQVYLCKHCGMEYRTARELTLNWCQNHPSGKGGRHELYEGSIKQQYTCKHCGMNYRSLRDLTRNFCQRNPSGRKCHEPAL
jgi:DNA-directed RNA polymerase subunit RPC12/RpoP